MVQTVKARAPMPASRRAKQFQPFDALKGFKEAIAAKEVLTVPKRELAEDGIKELNNTISRLQRGQIITVVYYGAAEQNYLQITGSMKKIDPYWNRIQIDNVFISFSDVLKIIAAS